MIVTSIKKHIGLLRQRERGQVLYLVAGLLVIMGGMTAGAIDFGSYAADRRDLQNAADAIALAAAQELPNGGNAIAQANQYAMENDIPISDMTVNVIPQSIPSQPNPEVEVTLDQEHGFFFARMIGIDSAAVSAKADAIKTSPSGGTGMVPLSVTQDALAGAALGEYVVLKYDANDITQGNTNPLAIDGTGTGNCTAGDQYCNGILDGTDTTICALGTDGTYCSGPTSVDTQPGNVISGTRTALDWRLTNTDVHCDEFTEVFEDDPLVSDPDYWRITFDCNPFLPGGYDSYRVLIVPVIQEQCNGSCTVVIVDFALFFFEGFNSINGPSTNPVQSCTGNQCEIVGRFVRANQNIGLLAGTFDESALNSFVRLVE